MTAATHAETSPPPTSENMSSVEDTRPTCPPGVGSLSLKYTVGVAVGCGALSVLIAVLAVCVYKKRQRRENTPDIRRRSPRNHKKLCATDSGTVSVSVQRVTNTPILLRGHESLPVDFLRDINRNSVHNSPGRSASFRHNPSFRNSPNLRDVPKRASSFRNSPSFRDDTKRSHRFRNSPSFRESPLIKDRFHKDGPRIIIADSSGQHIKGNPVRDNDSLMERMLSVESRRSTDSHQNVPANNTPVEMDGFMTCSSFDMKLNDEGGASSKGSLYDNLGSKEEMVGPSEDVDRKGSLYDNVDDKAAPCPAFDISKLSPAGLVAASDSPSCVRRRASYTLPLHFSLFRGHRLTGNPEDPEDPDYANVTPTEDPDYANVTGDVAEQQPGNRYSVTAKSPDQPPIPAKRKQRYRRGSQTLTLYCNKKLMPPVLSRIEQQVLQYVPIYGEPTPGTTPKSPAFAVLQFPPPPQTTPPDSPMLGHVNLMYSPTTAGTMTSNDYRGNAYFSV